MRFLLRHFPLHPLAWRNRLQWLGLGLMVAMLSGSAAALFLAGLDWLTAWRQAETRLLYGLPLAGWLVGWLYQRFGGLAVGGNKQLLDEFHVRKGGIPLVMAPLVLLGTWLTHAFGGSAGREGTAVQMGASLAQSMGKRLGFARRQQRALLLIGMAGGFGAVFGTPLAGAVFAIEVLGKGQQRYRHLLPALLTAWAAHGVCMAWGTQHTPYVSLSSFVWSPAQLGALCIAAFSFGLTARLFTGMGHFMGLQLARWFPALPTRAFVGGLVLTLVFAFTQNDRYIGLGVGVILEAFEQPLPWYDAFAKMGYTTFTLGAGFKGGEVTPLFFTGATLGSSLSAWLCLSTPWLAGLGLVAVFAGATHTPLACAIMAAELFGWQALLPAFVTCLLAVAVSGKQGIYGQRTVHPIKIERFFRS